MYYLVVNRINKDKEYPIEIIESNTFVYVGKDKDGYFQYGKYKRGFRKYIVLGCFKSKKKAKKKLNDEEINDGMLANM